jgi:hypothetical protein
VNCDQLRDHLLDGGASDAPEAERHAAECSACQELISAQILVETLRAPSSAELGGLTTLKHEVRAELAREAGTLSRLKSLSTRMRLCVALAVGMLIAVVEGTLLARVDMPLVPMGHLVPLLALLGLLAVAASWAALRPLFRQALPRSVEVGLLVLCLSVPIGLSFVQPETGHPVALKGSGPDHLRHVGTCLVHGLTLATLVWLAFRALDRQALKRGLAPLMAGMAAAVVATLGLQLHCAVPSAPHWLLGHASVGAIVLLALLLRRKYSNRA